MKRIKNRKIVVHVPSFAHFLEVIHGIRRPKDLEPSKKPKRKKKFIPKGCSEYWFHADGTYSTLNISGDPQEFYCIARSSENAKRKYERWKDGL